MRNLALVLVNLGVWALPATAAQEPTALTAEESAEIRVTAIRVLLRELRVETTSTSVLWIVSDEGRRVGPGGADAAELTEGEHSAIRAAFPTARPADTIESLFQCPPGVRVRMPGQGCPIRDAGVIVRLGSIEIERDTLRTSGELIQTAPGSRGPSTWASGLSLVFVRTAEGWVFRETRYHWIT